MSPCLDSPRRSLAELQRQLRGERIMLLLSQMEAEAAGCDAAAADCLRRIEDIDGRLRGIEGAEK